MCCQLLGRAHLTQRFAIIGYKAVVSKHQFHATFRLFSSTPVIFCWLESSYFRYPVVIHCTSLSQVRYRKSLNNERQLSAIRYILHLYTDSANFFKSLFPLCSDHVMMHLGGYNCCVCTYSYAISCACEDLHDCNIPNQVVLNGLQQGCKHVSRKLSRGRVCSKCRVILIIITLCLQWALKKSCLWMLLLLAIFIFCVRVGHVFIF